MLKQLSITLIVSLALLTLAHAKSKKTEPVAAPTQTLPNSQVNTVNAQDSNWNSAESLLGQTKVKEPEQPTTPTKITVQSTCTDRTGRVYQSNEDGFSMCMSDVRTQSPNNPNGQPKGGPHQSGSAPGVNFNYNLGK